MAAESERTFFVPVLLALLIVDTTLAVLGDMMYGGNGSLCGFQETRSNFWPATSIMLWLSSVAIYFATVVHLRSWEDDYVRMGLVPLAMGLTAALIGFMLGGTLC